MAPNQESVLVLQIGLELCGSKYIVVAVIQVITESPRVISQTFNKNVNLTTHARVHFSGTDSNKWKKKSKGRGRPYYVDTFIWGMAVFASLRKMIFVFSCPQQLNR